MQITVISNKLTLNNSTLPWKENTKELANILGKRLNFSKQILIVRGVVALAFKFLELFLKKCAFCNSNKTLIYKTRRITIIAYASTIEGFMQI